MSFDENDPLEYLLNAKTNLENMVRLNPYLKGDMLLSLAMEQLEKGIELYQKEELGQ